MGGIFSRKNRKPTLRTGSRWAFWGTSVRTYRVPILRSWRKEVHSEGAKLKCPSFLFWVSRTLTVCGVSITSTQCPPSPLL
jgi:hypothetical protein